MKRSQGGRERDRERERERKKERERGGGRGGGKEVREWGMRKTMIKKGEKRKVNLFNARSHTHKERTHK